MSIDPTSNLVNTKVFIAHGELDTIVPIVQAYKIRQYYEAFGVDSAKIEALLNIQAEHAIISNRRGTPCGQMNPPTFIENCNIDTVQKMFQHFYPNMVNPGADGEFSSSLKSFSQGEFFEKYASMSDTGYYYVPDACNSNGVT